MKLKIVILSMLSGLLGGVIFISIYNHTYHKSFGIVRMDKIVAGHLEEYGKKNLSAEERNSVAKQFAKVLESTVNDISRQEKVVLLVAAATVSKLPDYTERIEEEVKRSLRKM